MQLKQLIWFCLAVGSVLAQQTTTPSVFPSIVTSTLPSESPTSAPSVSPSISPTGAPTGSPTSVPTSTPTTSPSESPSPLPTTTPTQNPTFSPTTATPTDAPTTFPSQQPTSSPTTAPSKSPTTFPSESPSESPTSSPTQNPTGSPTTFPTKAPTKSPQVGPTLSPTSSPSAAPTESPSQSPTKEPTGRPTTSPTNLPTSSPTTSPSLAPTGSPVVAAPAGSDSPVGIIAGVVVALIVVSLLIVGFVYKDRFIGTKPPGGGSDDTKKQLDEYNKMTVDGAVLGQNGRKSSTKTDGTEGEVVVPITGGEKTLDDFTNANSKLEMGTSSTLGRKQNASLKRAMESETGLIEPGQVANVNILLQGVDKQRRKNMAIGKAQVSTLERKKNPQAAAVLPPKIKSSPKPPPVTSSKKSPPTTQPDLSVLTSGKKPAARKNISKADQEEFDKMMQPTSNYKAKEAQGKELSLDDFMTGVVTTEIPEDKEMSLDDFMTGVPQTAPTTPSGVKRSPAQESTKNGVKAEEPKEARPSSEYLTKAQAEENMKHRSIFAPSESFMKSATEKRMKEKIEAQNAAPPPEDDDIARPESAYLEQVDIEQNHKSIFRPSSLFLSQAKRDKALTKKRTEEKKKAAAAKKKFNIDSDI